MRLVVIIALCLLVIVPGYRATVKSDLQNAVLPEWCANLPSSPLVFEGSAGGRSLDLFNHSAKTIAAYRFGCVDEARGRVNILRKMKLLKTNLNPNEGLLN